jgi:Zn-dependent protease
MDEANDGLSTPAAENSLPEPVLSDQPPAPAPSAPPYEHEDEFQRTMEHLRTQRAKPGPSPALMLVLSMAAFVLMQGGADKPFNLAVLVGVLLFHELGHWVAMRALGWQDLRMFFIPFFGAAVSGRPPRAASWKEGVVLLAGPVPGLLLGLGLVLAVRGGVDARLGAIASSLLAINLFNLLPLTALDGGGVVRLTLFQRHRHLETLFSVCAALGMVAVAIWLRSWVLGALGGFSLLTLGPKRKVSGQAHLLRVRALVVPEHAKDLDDADARAVFVGAWAAWEGVEKKTPQLLANTMVQLVERLRTSGAPSALASVALLVALALSFGLGVGSLVLASHPPRTWRTVHNEALRYSVQLPGEPTRTDVPNAFGQTGVSSQMQLFENRELAMFVAAGVTPPEASLDLEKMVEGMRLKLAGQEGARASDIVATLAADGTPGFEAHVDRDDQRSTIRAFTRGERWYLLVATAKLNDDGAKRFLSSLAFDDSEAGSPFPKGEEPPRSP